MTTKMAVATPATVMASRRDDDGGGDHHGGQAGAAQAVDGGGELADGASAAGGDAQHAWQLADGDLDADTGEEADEHGAGQEVSEKAQPDQPGEQQDGAGEQC